MSAESELVDLAAYITKNYPSYVSADDTISVAVIRIFEALEVELGKCLEAEHDIVASDGSDVGP